MTGLTYREMREHSDYSCFLPWGEDQWWKEKVKLLILLDMSISNGGCRLVVIMTGPLGKQDLGPLLCLSTPLIHVRFYRHLKGTTSRWSNVNQFQLQVYNNAQKPWERDCGVK